MADAGVVQDGLQEAALKRAIAMVPPDQRAAIANAAVAGQIVFKREPYFSRVRLNPTITTGGSPVVTTYTYPKGTLVTFFTYGLNDVLLAAGFPAGIGFDQATYADTNLLHGSETNGGETVLTTGIGLFLSPDTDPAVAKALLKECFLSAGNDGNPTLFKWGQPMFWPAGGGFFGNGMNRIDEPSLLDTQIAASGITTNGIPGAEDFSKQIDPFIWGPKGTADSTFVAQLALMRAVTITSTARAAAASASGSTGVAAFVSPTANNPGAYQDLWLRLYGGQFSPRGKNR